MTAKLKRFLLTKRPFLWWWAMVMPIVVAGARLERGISYDDGGLGSLVFLGLITIGLPFTLAGQLFVWLATHVGLEPAPHDLLTGVVHLVGGSVPFLAADLLSVRWARSSDSRAALTRRR